MEEIASEMNFDEGIAMPVANLENKQLESEVRFAQENKIDTLNTRVYFQNNRNVLFNIFYYIVFFHVCWQDFCTIL